MSSVPKQTALLPFPSVRGLHTQSPREWIDADRSSTALTATVPLSFRKSVILLHAYQFFWLDILLQPFLGLHTGFYLPLMRAGYASGSDPSALTWVTALIFTQAQIMAVVHIHSPHLCKIRHAIECYTAGKCLALLSMYYFCLSNSSSQNLFQGIRKEEKKGFE